MHRLMSLFNGSVARAPRANEYPSLVGGRIYVVGDIHGRLDCLQRAQSAIDHDRHSRPVSEPTTEIYLGDYIDRGPDSYAVVALLQRRRHQVDTVLLKGNHELLIEGFLNGSLSFDRWRTLGGVETLVSYGIAASHLRPGYPVLPDFVAQSIPDEHRAFFKSLATYHTVGPYCFVHAGLRPGIAIEKQTVSDLTSIRGEFLSFTGGFGYTVVHGHTPVSDVDFLPNRINIDTGAYLTNRLAVLRIDADGPKLLLGNG